MNNNIKAPKQSIKKIFSNDFRLLVKMIKLSPIYFITMLCQGVIGGLTSSAEAVFTYRLFNELDSKTSTFKTLALIIASLAIFYLVAYAIEALYWMVYEPLIGKKLTLKMHNELFEKAKTIDISCYDDPEFYNDFVWSMDEAGGRSADLMADIRQIISRLVSAGTMFSLLFSIDFVAAIIIFVLSVILIIVRQIYNKTIFMQSTESKPYIRKQDYINRIFHLQDYSKEIRISGVTDLLMDEMDESSNKLVDLNRKYGKKIFVINGIFGDVLTEAGYFLLMIYLFMNLLNGSLLVGSFAATIGMIWRVRWMMSDLIMRITKFPEHSLFLEKYYGFLDYQPHTENDGDEVPPFESLEVENLSFTYDFTANPKYRFHKSTDRIVTATPPKTVLKNVNMTLKKGEKIAIVGYNGAGKTTLIKLLTRLYDPTQGRILQNGRDIREYSSKSYRSKIGVVFQDYKIFAASVAENVMYGLYDEEKDKETVQSSLDAAMFSEKLAKLDNGINTQMTREFDDNGTNLSGGEAQKLVIARVFAKPYDIIIMDEPSSALDPIAEYELNQSILKYASDKTVIFISHRLSTTRFADRIYMFDSGNLVEVGSHDELIEKNGKYAEMFNLQAEKYRK